MGAVVKEWRRWYSQHYRPQMEFLENEVSRLCSLAPVVDEERDAISRTAMRAGAAPPGMKRNGSLPATVGRRGSAAATEELPALSPHRTLGDRSTLSSQKMGASRAPSSGQPVKAR
mmetsp:Transcript_11940/g.27158  ORF Transcript_11940/g.27158 Transcript_11940/m.27158 type:complete len:116 (-) Transcript_11940:27-374(-)